jgi:hypothetical protein
LPHALVSGPCTVRAFWESFESREWRDGDLVARSVSAYLGNDSTAVLVECVVSEGFLRQIFLVHLLQKRHGVMVRLFPATSPEKTIGVRRCLEWIADEIAIQDPGCRWSAKALGLPGARG